MIRQQRLIWIVAFFIISTLTTAYAEPSMEEKLMEAVRAIHPVDVATLLNQGADPNFRTNDSSVLDEAAIFLKKHGTRITDKAVILKLLLKAGANPNMPSGRWARTPLMTAAGITTAITYSEGHPLLISLLLEAGADPNATSSFLGSTALHFAADYAKVENIEALLSGGAKVDLQDSLGNTALTRLLLFHEDVAEQQILDAVELLLSAGSSVRHCDMDEENPVDKMTKAKMYRVAERLRKAMEEKGFFRCGR